MTKEGREKTVAGIREKAKALKNAIKNEVSS